MNGDKKAREELIIEYLPLVKYIVERMKDNLSPKLKMESNDLVSNGIIGLIDAIEKFDLSRGLKFETYAIPRIRGSIVDELRLSDDAPRSLRQKAKRLLEAHVKLEKELGREAKDVELAEELGMDMSSYNLMLAEVNRMSLVSLEDFIVSDSDSTLTFSERLDDKLAENPLQVLEAKDIKAALARGIESLAKQERIVISLYYHDGLTLKEASQVLGLSESRVSQIRTKAVLRLREMLSHLEQDALV
ncbi:MAG: FliA/WhiG family RNA polymerase sigma factor [Actinomycetota bacterium]|nr:FliA/WhiG family RNA polymerase sigma factor [Actinomycetota bacterium]